MSGSLVDLSRPDVAIPDPVVLDTTVVIAFLQAYFPGAHPQQVARASRFFAHLRAGNRQAILTPSTRGPKAPAHRARRNAAFAAWNPHMPCTPPPGGVEDEQR